MARPAGRPRRRGTVGRTRGAGVKPLDCRTSLIPGIRNKISGISMARNRVVQAPLIRRGWAKALVEGRASCETKETTMLNKVIAEIGRASCREGVGQDV